MAGGPPIETRIIRHHGGGDNADDTDRPALDRVTGIVKEIRSTLQSITHFIHYR